MKTKTEHLHIRACVELKDYLGKFDTISKGVYDLYYTHRDLHNALIDGGLESLEPSDLVGLIRCLVNDKKRLRGKTGRSK